MATEQTVVVLNDFSGVTFDERTRTTSAGTSVRYTMSIEAQPILMNLDGIDVGAGPSKAILDLIQKQHGDISEIASPATLRRREVEKVAYERGDPKTVAKYSGGRTGATPPVGRSASRFGIHSGRLKGGYFLRQNPKEGTWTVNVPANRFDPTTFGGGKAALAEFIRRLVEHVPALAGKGIREDAGFVRALGQSVAVKAINRGIVDWKTYAKIGIKSGLALVRGARGGL